MPNGGAPDRVFVLLDCFFATYGHWPTRVRLPSAYIPMLEAMYPGSVEKLQAKVELVTQGGAHNLIAEDDAGATFEYGQSWPPTAVSSSDWLGMSGETH